MTIITDLTLKHGTGVKPKDINRWEKGILIFYELMTWAMRSASLLNYLFFGL